MIAWPCKKRAKQSKRERTNEQQQKKKTDTDHFMDVNTEVVWNIRSYEMSMYNAQTGMSFYLISLVLLSLLLLLSSSSSLTSSSSFALKNRLTGYYNGKQFCSGNRFIRTFIFLTTAIFIYLFCLSDCFVVVVPAASFKTPTQAFIYLENLHTVKP